VGAGRRDDVKPRQGASSPARSDHLEPLAWGDTDEAAVGVVAVGRAAGEEDAVARRVGLDRQRRRQPAPLRQRVANVPSNSDGAETSGGVEIAVSTNGGG
jgi:hypothetical protein